MSVTGRGFLALTFGCLLGVGSALAPGALADREPVVDTTGLPWEEARLLAEVLERVQRDYVDDIDQEMLIEGAIRGMVAELDAHSAFLDSDEYREIRISTTGNYSGVGLEVNLVEGVVRVVSPIDDTPAYAAGIQPGDVIIAVDGEAVDEDNLNDTVSRMRGEPGSRVDLTIKREGELLPLEFTLNRATIQVASVKSQLLEPGYGYVRITQFSETTSRDLVDAVRELEGSNGGSLDGLVMDLRNNPGGVLDAAVEVSDAFLDAGLIVSADGRVNDARFSMSARPGDILKGEPIAVLVNAGSASASEIVAGALKDHGRAVIMGKPTYGKGSVQTVMPLSNGRAIKLTTSRYYTPSGESIHESGIEPDIDLSRDEVELGTSASAAETAAKPLLERDSVARQALAYLKENRQGRILQSKAR